MESVRLWHGARELMQKFIKTCSICVDPRYDGQVLCQNVCQLNVLADYSAEQAQDILDRLLRLRFRGLQNLPPCRRPATSDQRRDRDRTARGSS